MRTSLRKHLMPPKISNAHLLRMPTNREAVHLYREILRTSRAFYWPNENGEQWSQVLATSARKEFEEARYEMDPVIIARLLVVGRDALMQAQNKFTEMEEKMKEHIAKTKTS